MDNKEITDMSNILAKSIFNFTARRIVKQIHKNDLNLKSGDFASIIVTTMANVCMNVMNWLTGIINKPGLEPVKSEFFINMLIAGLQNLKDENKSRIIQPSDLH